MSQRTVPYLLLFLLRLAGSASARPAADGDSTTSPPPDAHAADTSLRAYLLDEIIVTATRTDTRFAALPSSVTSLVRSRIDAAPGGTMASTLQGVTALNIRPYGGEHALHSVSLRGMGAEHTLVLVDGQRYTNFQNGQVDFGILSSSNVERVEIAKGGFSALYGADALGGVINIVTRKPTDGFHGQMRLSSGSNAFTGYDLMLSRSFDPIAGRIFLRREHGNGQYDYDFSDGRNIARLERSGADFQTLSAGGVLDITPSRGVRTIVSLTYDEAKRGVPGPVTDRDVTGSARLNDASTRLQIAADWNALHWITFSVKSSFHHAHETYRDPLLLINNEPLNSYHTNRAWFTTPEVRFAFSPTLSGILGGELARATITSNEVGRVVRWQRSVFLSAQHTVSFPESTPFEVVVYPSVRIDDFSDVASDISPKVGVNIGLIKSPVLRVRSSISKNFRVPTFNDLYWSHGGNPHLRPERSLSIDAGMVAHYGSLRLEADYFSIRIHDRIVWTPGSGGIWSPKNIATVSSEGIEAEMTWGGFDRALILTVNSTVLTARKKSTDYPGDPTFGKVLPYVPQQTANVSVLFTRAPFTVFVQHAWASYRYTTEINDRFLPRYGVTSGAITFAYPLAASVLSLKLEGTNLFNTSYQVIALYPMPLRELRATLGVEL